MSGIRSSLLGASGRLRCRSSRCGSLHHTAALNHTSRQAEVNARVQAFSSAAMFHTVLGVALSDARSSRLGAARATAAVRGRGQSRNERVASVADAARTDALADAAIQSASRARAELLALTDAAQIGVCSASGLATVVANPDHVRRAAVSTSLGEQHHVAFSNTSRLGGGRSSSCRGVSGRASSRALGHHAQSAQMASTFHSAQLGSLFPAPSSFTVARTHRPRSSDRGRRGTLGAAVLENDLAAISVLGGHTAHVIRANSAVCFGASLGASGQDRSGGRRSRPSHQHLAHGAASASFFVDSTCSHASSRRTRLALGLGAFHQFAPRALRAPVGRARLKHRAKTIRASLAFLGLADHRHATIALRAAFLVHRLLADTESDRAGRASQLRAGVLEARAATQASVCVHRSRSAAESRTARIALGSRAHLLRNTRRAQGTAVLVDLHIRAWALSCRARRAHRLLAGHGHAGVARRATLRVLCTSSRDAHRSLRTVAATVCNRANIGNALGASSASRQRVHLGSNNSRIRRALRAR